MKNPKVAIIDYHMGNLFSVLQGCRHVGLEPVITVDPKEILAARAAILPGVGAFGEAMSNLESLGLPGVIKSFIDSGKPFMGICLGMQLLLSESEEFGTFQGLNVIEGCVRKFPNRNAQGFPMRVPQIGWNKIKPNPEGLAWGKTPLAENAPGVFMYFVHSFYCRPQNKADALTLTSYEGFEYCSGLMRKNVFATQFHPEKSAREGLKIYRNWADLVKKSEGSDRL